MLPTEKKHYTRREEQPLPLPQPSKIIVNCLFCQQLVNSGLGTKRKSNNDGKGFRLDKLLNHIQRCHKDIIMDDNAKNLFDVGFFSNTSWPRWLGSRRRNSRWAFWWTHRDWYPWWWSMGGASPSTSAPRGAAATARFRIPYASTEMDDVVM